MILLEDSYECAGAFHISKAKISYRANFYIISFHFIKKTHKKKRHLTIINLFQ